MALRDQLAEDDIFREHVHFRADMDRTRRLLDVLLGLRNAESAEFVLAALKTDRHDPQRLGEFVHFATRYVAAHRLAAVTDYVLTWQQAEPERQMLAFRSHSTAVAERGAKLPPAILGWAEELARQLLASSDSTSRIDGIRLIGSLHLRSMYEPVARIAEDREAGTDLRVAAFLACVETTDPRCVALLDAILGNLDEAPEMRRVSALALSLVNTDDSRRVLHARLPTAHHRLATEIAGALASSQAGAEMLLNAIAAGKASPLLLRELRVLRELEAIKVANLTDRIAELTKNLPPSDEMTAQQIALRRRVYLASKPDVQLGRAAFKKHCEICHQMNGEGNKFGPDLDGIGVRGLDRLLEDTLDPSRNVDPAFQTTIVITDRGLTRTGLAVRDEGKVLLLVDSDGNELRIPHDEIDERSMSSLSPMPAALEKTLTDADYLHLVRFLLSATEPLKPNPDQPTGHGGD
jgi:putative heme-binding domain-containing protein